MVFDQTTLLGRFIRRFAILLTLSLIAACSGAASSKAAPYASYLMDARTGEVLAQENAETRLHPASLTKMMTLYIAFQDIERGKLTLDTMITVSKNAAAQPPSRLGLKAGQKIQLRYLIRAAAIKSANDAAQAIGDAIGGNQAQFAERMTRTAKTLGMHNTRFKNANGLTAKGHVSTAKDMSILGRHLFYDFPQYYNIFARRSTDAGLATVANTNRKFLNAYEGADGIKTGYTQAAGFNLTASAERNGVRLIATVFGGKSTPDRNARISRLLDKGFAMTKGKGGGPAPVLRNADDELIANAAVPEMDGPADGAPSAAKTLRLVVTLKTSPRPMARPDMAELADDAEIMVAQMADDIAGALAEAVGGAAVEAEPLPFAIAQNAPPADLPFALVPDAPPTAVVTSLRPAAKPDEILAMSRAADPGLGADEPVSADAVIAKAADQDLTPDPAVPPAEPMVAQVLGAPAASADSAADPAAQLAMAPAPSLPAASAEKTNRKAPIFDAAPAQMAVAPPPAPIKREVVTRVSTSGAKHFGINIGRFKSADSAERILLKTQLVESATLSGSLRKVTQKGGGFDANFLGLSQEAANLACRRLAARSITCITLGP